VTDPLNPQQAAAEEGTHAGAGPAPNGPSHGAHRHAGGHDGATASDEPGGADEFDVPASAAAAYTDTDTDTDTDADTGTDAGFDDGFDTGPDEPEAVITGAVNDERCTRADEENGEHPDTTLAAERLSDLQRLQAEYVNYKKRVDRDRAVARQLGVAQVLDALLPVLDDIHLAREHGDLEAGPFAAIAEKLEAVLGKFGVERFGAVGEEFDPLVHEALMHVDADLDESAMVTTVVQILQPGYRTGDRIVRPARVSVAGPR